MLNNSNQKLKKMVVSLTIVALTYSNFVLAGSKMYKGLVSYAEDGIQTETESEENDVLCEALLETNDIHKTTMTEENTNFDEKLNLKLKNVKNVLMEDLTTSFFDMEDNETEDAKLKYVKTKLNKEDLKNILGEEGSLEVLDEEDNVIAKISVTEIQKLEQLMEEAKEENEEDDEKTTLYVSLPQEFTKTIEEENDEGELEEKEVKEKRSNLVLSSKDSLEITYELEENKLKFKFTNINTVINEELSLTTETENDEEDEKENKVVNFVIENTKSIFDVQDLENLNYLKEEINYTFDEIEDKNDDLNLTTGTDDDNGEEENKEDEKNNKIESIVKFKDTVTRARLETDNQELELGKTNTVKYRVILDTTTEKAELFKNPIFILELPEEVESVNTKNSQFTIDNGEVFTKKSVTVATLLGRKYVVIQLEGEQTEESIQNGNSIINLSLELNIREGEEKNQRIKLYYQNDTVTAYESGVGFDTDEVNISLVLGSKEAEEIVEQQETTENEEQVGEENNEEENSLNNIKVYTNIGNDEKLVKVGEEFEYLVYIYNYGEDLKNSELEYVIPDGLEYLDAKLYEYNVEDSDFTTEKNIEGALQYTVDSKSLSADINKIEEGTTVLKIRVKTNNLKEDEYSKIINSQIKLLQNEKTVEKENVEVTVSDAFLDVSITNVNEKVGIEDVVEYKITVKNLGLFQSEEKTVKMKIPEELKAGTISIYDDETEEANFIVPMEGNEDEITFVVGAEKSKTIKFTALYETAVEENKKVTAVATIDGEEYNFTNKLLRVGNYGEDVEADDEEENPTDPTNPNNPNDPSNPTDPSNPSDPSDPSNPSDPTNPSNPSDPSNPSNPNDPSNPTDPNKPDEENTEKPEFDLSLTQSLKKITVSNEKGTTTYDYKDANFAKVEIHSKQMNGSLVTIEYEITVKNEGTIAGYARKIADYIPTGLEFNSELNPDWYVGEDGNLYSVALIDNLLNPEDTKTLKLVLTKKMTNENTGTFTNIAEIYEATNEAEVEDINSTPGDKKNNQNDIAKVDVMITVSTGTIALYTILAMVVLAILGFGIFKVKNITLKKEEK